MLQYLFADKNADWYLTTKEGCWKYSDSLLSRRIKIVEALIKVEVDKLFMLFVLFCEMKILN